MHELIQPVTIHHVQSSRALYDKRISQEVSGEDLGDEFAGYVSNNISRDCKYEHDDVRYLINTDPFCLF